MSDIAIKVENLSKKYIIGHGQSGSLRETLANTWHSTFGGKRSDQEEFWALQDINFEIKQGEAVGIIGRNGAGKSTLLKLLSKITYPTRGKITMNGRVSSLLEVGTGFHPELTGRENIYLNGTILGMSRREVKAKFDEIVAFSGVEKFLDTPVKRYSSGMYVRLAFAVAAHLEPEILIIDEVLAVGDAEFQKKCLGKMDEVAKGGRTVLFVSHNMAAVEALCSEGILLKNGFLKKIGCVNNVIESYFENSISSISRKIELNKLPRYGGEGALRFFQLYLNKESFDVDDTVKLQFKFQSIKKRLFKNLKIGVHIYDSQGIMIFHISNMFISKEVNEHKDNNCYTFEFDNGLRPGKYNIQLTLIANGIEEDLIQEGVYMIVRDSNKYNYPNSSIIKGLVQPSFNFYIND